MSKSSEVTEIRSEPTAISEAQQAVLTQKTPPEVIRQRPGPGGRALSYVEHAWVTEQLNLAFNWAWSWEVVEWRLLPEQDPTEVFVLGQLTVHALHGDLVKSQFGSSDVKRNRNGGPLSIGDDLKAASSDALKKCASLLGLALDLYRTDDDRREDPRPPAPAEWGDSAVGRKPANGNGKAAGSPSASPPPAPLVFKSVNEAVAWGLKHTRKGKPIFDDRNDAQRVYDEAKAAYTASCHAKGGKADAAGMRDWWVAEVVRRVAEDSKDGEHSIPGEEN